MTEHLKMIALPSFETLRNTRLKTRRHIVEDLNLNLSLIRLCTTALAGQLDITVSFFFSKIQTLFYMCILGLKFNQVHIITILLLTIFLLIWCINDLFVPTNALRQFFHCLIYYYVAPIRISTVILPSSGGILRSFYIDQFLVTSYWRNVIIK
jgi:hypothetical protein